MATATEVRSLANAYRTQQTQRAAVIAALVAAYYRSRVDVEDPGAVERWLDIWLPRILRQQATIADLAARYASETRTLELPTAPTLTFEAAQGSIEEQIRTSLRVVGPTDFLNKARQIDRIDGTDLQRQAMLVEAKQVTSQKVAAAVVRHAQSGGRNTIIEASRSDRLALGYVRVTKAKPCFFCAMLASRGIVFAEDSFDASDARFTGDGTAKVHDSCACGMKQVYVADDPLVKDTEVFADQWTRWGAGGGGSKSVLRFRRGYEHWAKTGEYLDWDVVNDAEAYYARNSAA